MITLHITRADDYEGVYLPLPTTPAEIGEAWVELDTISGDVASTRIVGAVSDVWGIGQYLKNADVTAHGQFEKLNRIAEIVGGINKEQCRIFEGALDAESINSLDDVIAIGERLEQYLLIPDVTTDRELGVYLVETGVTPFDESVWSYLDYSKIGSEYYSKHGGAYTTSGYVLRWDSIGQELLKNLNQKYVSEHSVAFQNPKLYIESDTLREVYFNPDSDAGGQLVTNHYSPAAILEAIERHGDPADFWSCLEGKATQYLTDIDTSDFASEAQDFVEAPCDFGGADESVMTGLRDWAQGVEQQQSQTMQLQ